jgi:hypothetical protein
MQTDMAVAHLTFEFRPRYQGRDAVDDQHVDRAGAHQRVGDFQPLLARIRLTDEKIIHIHTELAGIGRVERVLGVDKGADAAFFLGFGNGVQRQRGLAGAFRAVDLDHPALRQAADAERQIEPERAGRHHLDRFAGSLGAHPHDRALAEGALDLSHCGIQCFVLFQIGLPCGGVFRKLGEIAHRRQTPLLPRCRNSHSSPPWKIECRESAWSWLSSHDQNILATRILGSY